MFTARLIGFILSVGLSLTTIVTAQEENNETQTNKHTFQISGQNDSKGGSIKIQVDGETVYEKKIELGENWKENIKSILDEATKLPDDIAQKLKEINKKAAISVDLGSFQLRRLLPGNRDIVNELKKLGSDIEKQVALMKNFRSGFKNDMTRALTKVLPREHFNQIPFYVQNLDLEMFWANMSKELEEDLLNFIQKANPSLKNAMMKLKSSHPTLYKRLLYAANNKLENLQNKLEAATFSSQNPLIAKGEAESMKLVNAYQQAQNLEKKTEIRKELQKVLEGLFDIKEQQRKEDIEALESEVNKLRDLLNKRQENKDNIIDNRLRELLNEEDESLKW